MVSNIFLFTEVTTVATVSRGNPGMQVKSFCPYINKIIAKWCDTIVHFLNFHIKTVQCSDGNQGRLDYSVRTDYQPISLSISVLLAKLHKISSHKNNNKMCLRFIWFLVWRNHKKKPRWVGNRKGNENWKLFIW